jgi:hypothetical protein
MFNRKKKSPEIGIQFSSKKIIASPCRITLQKKSSIHKITYDCFGYINDGLFRKFAYMSRNSSEGIIVHFLKIPMDKSELLIKNGKNETDEFMWTYKPL